MASFLDILNASAAVATAVGVFVAVLQIRVQLRQDATEFEDDLDKEAREIFLALPIAALLGEPISREEAVTALEQFHRYFDLCNQQVFLRGSKRISDARWESWADEMAINLAKPAFHAAWAEIKRRAPAEFVLLRRLESTGFKMDPEDW